MVHLEHSKQIYSDEAHEKEPEFPRVRGIVVEEGTSEEHDDRDMTKL